MRFKPAIAGLYLLVVALFCDSAAAAHGQQWVLQLGYFANRGNALRLKRRLVDAGFEAFAIAMVDKDGQGYRVVSGNATHPAGLHDLRDLIETQTGVRGFATQTPFGNESAEEIFDQPAVRHRVAQASPNSGSGNPTIRISGYDAPLNRIPREKTDSVPGFTAAGFQIIPTIGLSLGYDDNITLAQSDKISSLFYMISPSIRAELPSDHSVLALIAKADFIKYQDSPLDDTNDWSLRGEWVWDISTRQDANIFAQFTDGADKRGEGRRQGNIGQIEYPLDKWKRWDLGGDWYYGAVGASGRLELKAGLTDLRYTNNREDINGFPGTRNFDRDNHFYGGAFYWRLAPKTAVLLEYLHTDINYALEDQLDSEEESWLAGITWDATARTSGTIKFGYLSKDFANPERGDYSGKTWAATVNWRPRSYSVFSLTTTRSSDEPYGFGDYVLRQDVTISWVHDWATRFGTIVDVGFGRDSYRPIDRKDDLFYWGVGLRYTFSTHFRFGASVTSYDRSSVVEQFDYEQWVYLLTLEASF
jgi:hypothetical protein